MRVHKLKAIPVDAVSHRLVRDLRLRPKGECIHLKLLELFLVAAQLHGVVQRSHCIPCFKRRKLLVRHPVRLNPPPHAQDMISLVVERIHHLQIALFPVELDRNGIQIIPVPFIGDFNIDRMTVKHGPVPLEIVFEDACFPIRIDVGVTA